MKGYLFLLIAIAGEIIGTSSLKGTAGFTKFWPSVGVVLGYAAAFYFLALTLKYVPLGVTYAIWSGVGTALTAIIGVLFWNEKLSLIGVAGILLIIAGVILLHLSR